MQPAGQSRTHVIFSTYSRNLAEMADNRVAAATLASQGRDRPSCRGLRSLCADFVGARLSTPYSGRACSRPNGWVSAAGIRVCGNGIGISPDVLARRFQPFTAFIILKSSQNLIILDLALPIVDGFAMLPEGRGENATIGRQVPVRGEERSGRKILRARRHQSSKSNFVLRLFSDRNLVDMASDMTIFIDTVSHYNCLIL